GLTLLDDRLIQVIWLHKTDFMYDRQNLGKVKMVVPDKRLLLSAFSKENDVIGGSQEEVW
ncbi:hypothetical protein MKW98_011503, partial [Papaver atlanticum]